MATLRERVEQHDRDAFVGRDAEVRRFDEILRGEHPARVVHVTGTGGIGKSTLLREVARRAAASGYDVRWIDGRDLPPFPSSLDEALEPLAPLGKVLVVFDSYELVSTLDGHLRDRVVPGLPETAVVVFGSRRRPARGWFEGGWDAVVESIELGPLTAADSRALVRAHGVADDAVAADLVRSSHGSPLALVVGAHAGGGGSYAELAERLLGDEVDTDRYRTLAVAAIARVTTPGLLEAVLPDQDPYEAYKWLADRSFSEPLADGVALHALVATAVRASLRERDPAGEAVLRRRIADDVHRRAVAGRFTLSADLQHLVADPDVRWGYAADVGSRYRIDVLRPGDAEWIGQVLRAVGVGAWWDRTEVFFTQHPECVGIARDHDGKVGGYYVAVAPANPPSAALDDVLLGPWLRHARDELRTTRAVLWREAVDLTGEMGEVTSLLGYGGLLSTGVVNPRYGYLPINPLLPAARAFSEALGARHLSALDVDADGMALECHLVDFGPGGLLGFQRDWIYRETGAVPPDDAVDPAELVRLLRDPAALDDGPSWLGDRPSERRERLESLVRDALAVFGDGRDDALARAIVEAAYLGDGAPHEAIARRFHLSRSAYFRRLQSATARVAAELAARRADGA